MIRKNLLNFKLNLPVDSIKTRFDSFMESFNPACERCPSCGAMGQCRVFACYDRGIVELTDKIVCFHHIRVLRVKCSCGRTHAIIPDFLVPYRRFSLPFILYVLQLYFRRSMTIEKLCETFEFSHTTLYRWKAAFRKHQSWWVDFIHLGKQPSLAFLEKLLENDPFSGFTRDFFLKTLYSFHQSHTNPSNCRHLPPGWPSPERAAT